MDGPHRPKSVQNITFCIGRAEELFPFWGPTHACGSSVEVIGWALGFPFWEPTVTTVPSWVDTPFICFHMFSYVLICCGTCDFLTVDESGTGKVKHVSMCPLQTRQWSLVVPTPDLEAASILCYDGASCQLCASCLHLICLGVFYGFLLAYHLGHNR